MSKRPRTLKVPSRTVVVRDTHQQLTRRLSQAGDSTKADFSAFVEFETARLGRDLDAEERLRALALVEATAPRR